MNTSLFRGILALQFLGMLTGLALAGEVTLSETTRPDLKAVYGRVEPKNMLAARARIGGTIVDLTVTEGSQVKAGQEIARVRDEKLEFQMKAMDAGLKALNASLVNARNDLARAEELAKSGTATVQRLDALRTQVDVLSSQIAAKQAERDVVAEQAKEGAVLAPTDGLVLTVPVTRETVIMAGEPVATIGGGGFFLRLTLPERHALLLKEGAAIDIGPDGAKGKLVKLYPEIDNGRVVADVEVEGLDPKFINSRLLVRVPVGERPVLLLPKAAVVTRHGIDFVTVKAGAESVERTIVTSRPEMIDGTEMVEVLSGLEAGAKVVVP